jgi:hypothetical protein
MDSNQQPQIQNTGVGQPYPGFPQANPGVSAGAAPGLTPAAGAFAGPPAGMPAQPAAMPYAAAPQPPQPTPMPPMIPAQPMPTMPSGIAGTGQPVTAGAGPTAHVAPSNPNSTQNALQIAEIRDGIVIMGDGSFRSVVMVKSINFDLMSPQEQEAVEFSYQGFLNSLYFPIQIFIRSQKVDLQPYLEKLDKIRTEHDNMLLALLMDDYIGYMDQLSAQTNIMDKKFYIVIPFFPVADVQKAFTQSKNFFTGLGQLFNKAENRVVINEAELEKAKAELRNRVQAVLAGLQQCNIQGLPLDTQELIELYYDTYNPDTATRQQLKNFNDLTADVVTKGAGMAPQTHLQRELQ